VSIWVVGRLGRCERYTVRLPWRPFELGAFRTGRTGWFILGSTVLGKVISHFAVNARTVFSARAKAVKVLVSSTVAALEPLPRVSLLAEVGLVLVAGRMRDDVATVSSDARRKCVVGHVVEFGKSL
jgi:hypothetical protein